MKNTFNSEYRNRNAALIVLYNAESKILIQKRDNNTPLYPNYWGLFGGGIKKGETPLEAVKRECFEELEYQLVNPILRYEAKYTEEQLKLFGIRYYFTEKFKDESKIVLNEGNDFGWYSIEEIEHMHFVPFNFRILKLIEKYI